MSNPKFGAVLLCVYNCFGFDNHIVENMSTGKNFIHLSFFISVKPTSLNSKKKKNQTKYTHVVSLLIQNNAMTHLKQ